MTGWIKLHRSILDNDLWEAEPFSYGQAWVDILLSANHSHKTMFIRSIEIHIDRGQLGWSEVSMSKRWKWSRGKVRRYLGMLEKRGMIEQQKTHVTTIISVCNYSNYQSTKDPKEQPAEHRAEHQTDTKRTPDGTQHKNGKNGKNEKSEGSCEPRPSPNAGKILFRTWIDRIRESGEKPIPDSDPLITYAADAGIPHEYLAIAWEEFKTRYLDEDKKYKDWRAVFRKAVRGNWMKFWWINDGQYQLTSLGQQAMAAYNAKGNQ